MVDSTKVLCPENTNVVCPSMWTFYICAAVPVSAGTYYYWQNHDIFQWCKQNTTVCPITGNKYTRVPVPSTNSTKHPNQLSERFKDVRKQI